MRAAYPLLVCLFLCLALTQAPATDKSAVQVLYVGDGTNLYTYNIDAETLQPTLAGTTPYPAAYGMQLATSSDGSFLYFLASANGSTGENRIYVYNTDANGVPGQVLQSVSAAAEWPIVVDPTNAFLYTVYSSNHGQTSQTYFIYRYRINSTNGKITQQLKEATYVLPWDATDGSCALEIAGMSSTGGKIYDAELCWTHDSNTGSYDERTIDSQTGALGSPVQIFSWDENNDGGDTVQFIGSLIFDFASPIFGYPINAVSVYPLQPDSTTPGIDCNSGSCATDSGIAHPSGKYVFLTNPTENTTEVDSVDLTSKHIVPTGTVFANPGTSTLFFSPDGSVVYSLDSSSSTVAIFGFNPNNAAITPGGTVSQPPIQNWLAVERK
jgi:hypothetical protein